MGGRRVCYACFVLSDDQGLGIVDERKTESAIRVARYKADEQGKPGYATRTTKLLPRPGGCFVLWFVCLLFSLC